LIHQQQQILTGKFDFHKRSGLGLNQQHFIHSFKSSLTHVESKLVVFDVPIVGFDDLLVGFHELVDLRIGQVAFDQRVVHWVLIADCYDGEELE
jgi:hypothetical protein